MSKEDLAYYYDAEIRELGEQIWQEQALPAAGERRQYQRRAQQRAALLYLDSLRPAAGWSGALQSCWNQLFGPRWATTEKGRGLRDVLVALAVNVNNEVAAKKAREWVLARVMREAR